MITLNHIGIATDPDQSPNQLEKLFQLLGITRGASEPVPEQGVVVHFFALQGSPPHLELLDAQDSDGPVAKFVKNRGPGIHHLSFLVDHGKLDGLCAKLKEEGFQFLGAPKAGAQNMRVTFIHPKSAGGVLIELMEPV